MKGAMLDSVAYKSVEVQANGKRTELGRSSRGSVRRSACARPYVCTSDRDEPATIPQATQVSTTHIRGAHLLHEIAAEECTLEVVLSSLRTLHLPRTPVPSLPPALARLYHAHSLRLPGPLTIRNSPMSAASTALALHILAHQLGTCGGAVALLDFTGRFAVAPLAALCGPEALQHLHVFRPVGDPHRLCAAVKRWILYGAHASGGRVWLGTMLLGGEGAGSWDGMGGLLVRFGWKGWLSVARDEAPGYAAGTSVEEVWERRFATEPRCWRAWCEEGEYRWQ